MQRDSLLNQENKLIAFEISKIKKKKKRKKIRTSLISFINEDHLLKINIDPNLRASDLSPKMYYEIAKELQ